MGQLSPPEELFDFPCDYQFKVFTDAPNREDFCQQLVAAIKPITPVVNDSLQMRPSSKGTYVCVSLTAFVSSRKQVENIYAVLRELEGVRYTL